eukprot:CAMPEP_0184692408 /NCGR_PEP_ID=MMETSP0313-20130426/903_1 /TAXON_ID=2792 /ORGANISM="Porphyridium aerugineum, Strain SAG 1380-2" /LENGTH=83 /DNA_ID=CAMNT_0027150235 /DNA_START=172 /DNA_END=423 /DNA_ORIENTATION=+
MGGDHRRYIPIDHTKPYNGIGDVMPQPRRVHVLAGKALGACMWFWIMWRVKHDFPVILGWRHPWERGGLGYVPEESEEGSHHH